MSLMDGDSAKFDTLVPKMNDQQQKLIGVMNKLYERHAAQAPKAELNRLLVELRDYTILHFREEEAFLDKIQFPQLRTHKNIHQKLLEDFTMHYTTFANGDGSIAPAFFDFLRLWLTSHIRHIDRKYGEFNRQHGAA